MRLTASDSMLATVLYADIFRWPLSETELKRWSVFFPLRSVPHKKYFVLPGKEHLIGERLQRERWAKEKWRIARSVGNWLRLVPSLKLVGVTGGLSRANVSQADDIDLFCITAPGTLWTTRVLALCIVAFLGRRRKPAESYVKDKICLNMFMSENALGLARQEQDLFTAYEVLQMEPLWERDGAYKKFLRFNQWAKKFLPNAWRERTNGKQHRVYRKKVFLFSPFSFLFTLIEPLARSTQLWYMKRRRTSEVIRPGLLRFHPRDARIWIKQAFRARLRRFNLPLDNIFYGR